MERERVERERYTRIAQEPRERHDSYGSNFSYHHRQDHLAEHDRTEDEWKHVENVSASSYLTGNLSIAFSQTAKMF